MNINSLQKFNPFDFNKRKKNKIYIDQIKLLSLHHYNRCAKYKKIINNLKFKLKNKNKLEDFPMRPVRIFKKFDLPDLKYFTQAGGALRKDLIEYFLTYSEKSKKEFVVMYGQTEATARMTYLPYQMLRKKIGSVGIPITEGKIHLVSNKSKNDNKGEIIYEGKNVSLGYAKNFKDLAKKDENKGILKTGDLAAKDSDGYLYITGRKSRDIKLFGHRVNLDEVEQILFKKGYNCKCCGIDNKVTIFHIDNTYTGEILKYISKQINIHLDCFKLKRIKEFPLNENGKASYEKLEKFL